MKLMALNPFAPRDPEDQAKFVKVSKRELLVYRRKPRFWLSLIVVLVSSLYLIVTKLDPVGRLVGLVIVFGLALAYDSVTSHFVKRLIEEETKNSKIQEEA